VPHTTSLQFTGNRLRQLNQQLNPSSQQCFVTDFIEGRSLSKLIRMALLCRSKTSAGKQNGMPLCRSSETLQRDRNSLRFRQGIALSQGIHFRGQCRLNRSRNTEIICNAVYNRTANDDTVGCLRDCVDMIGIGNTEANHDW